MNNQADKKIMEQLPVPRIEIYQILGYNGGFAITRILLWRCDIVNASGKRETGSLRSIEKIYAKEAANEWKERTHWPVFDLGRQESYDDYPRG